MLRLRSRQVVILLTAAVAILYLVYRVIFTLNLTTTYATIASVLLYAGEVYGVLNMLLYFVQVWDVYEPPQQPILEGRTVDVFVPTYNEDPDLLRVTLRACVAMDYPHKTYLCDDGGTDARLNDPDKGPAARERAEKLRAMCTELGVIYVTRPKNNHAKAGNLNYAFERTDGEFLIIFDADHVPEPHFITRLVGYFADEKLAFVQTPHAFYNFDSFQARLNHAARKYWEEGQLFYHVIQPGRNRTGCPIFAGSAAMFRRSALKQVGYIATETITEDMHTGLRMHARGWKSLAISERLIAGQAAQDVTTFHSQRLRWGEGNLSVIFYDNPLTMRGLTWGQRLCYAATTLNWGSGLFKLAIYLTPLLMLFTGVPPVNQFTWTLGIGMAVYMAMSILGTKVAGNGYGSFWYSELFTMASFWTQVRGTTRALFWRKFQQFVVTAKRGRQSKSIWPFIRPQVYLMVFSALALLWAWSRLMLGLSDDPYKPMLASFWAFFHMLLAYLVVRRAFWPDDRRYATRHTLYLAATWKTTKPAPPQRGFAFISDLNDQGTTLIAYQALNVGELVRLTLHAPGRPVEVEGRIKSVRPLPAGQPGPGGTAGGFRHGIQFENRTQAQIDALNLLCLHYAVPKLYRYYAEGHQPLALKLAAWMAQRFHSRRFAERREYRLPLLLFPVGSPQRGAYAVTEDVSRLSMALLLHAPMETGTQVRYSLTSPLGEISGTGTVMRSERYDLAARPYYRTVVEYDRIDEEGREVVNDLFRPRNLRRLGPLLKPDKAPMPVHMDRPVLIGTVSILIMLGTEFAVFRLFYRDDFFLREVASIDRPLTADEIKRLDRVYRDTMQAGWPSTDRLVLLGKAMWKAERPAEVAEVTRRLAPRDPGNIDLQVALAHAHDQTEDFEKAEAEFRRLLSAVDQGALPESRREELLAGLARSVAHNGDPDAAAEYYQKLIAAYPGKLGYRHELAGQYLSARRYKEAARVYDGVDPGHEGRVMLVLIHTGAKDWPAAEREARTLLRDRADDPAIQGLLADVLNARGDYRQAKAIYERLLRSGEDERRIGIQLAYASLWAKEYDEALDRFQAVVDQSLDLTAMIRQYPQLLRAYVNAAASANRLTDAHRKTAGRLYELALTEQGNDPVYLARLGWVLHRLEEFDKSAALLDLALTLNPADVGLRMQLAGVLVAAGRPDRALQLLGDGATTPESRMLLVDVYLAAKNFEAAEKECRNLVTSNPGLREARVKLANILSWKGDYAASLRLFEELRTEQPDDGELAVRLAEVTLWSGDHAMALTRYQELLTADFDRPVLWYGYVDAAAGGKSLSTEQARLIDAIASRTLTGEHRSARALEEARVGGRVLKEIPYLTRLGWVLLDRVKDRDKATAILNMARMPTNATPAERKELAGVLAAAGRSEEALKLYDGLTLDVRDQVNVARIHAALGQFDAAAGHCREALKLQPLDREARRVLADVLSWDGQFRESLKEFDALLEAQPDAELRRRRAEVTLWSGDASRALTLFTELLKETPDQSDLWKGFIEAAGRADKLSDEQRQLAERVVARPEALPSKDVEFLARAGWVLHHHLDDPARAKRFLAQAVAQRPPEATVLVHLAWVLHQSGDSENAATVLDEALALRPRQPALMQELAGVLTAAKRFKEARGLYTELLKENPADKELETRLAEVTLWGGDAVAAAGLLAPLLEADFRRPDLWRTFVDAVSAAARLTDEQVKLTRRIAAEPLPEVGRDEQALFLSRLAWTLYREAERRNDAALRAEGGRLLDKLVAARPEGLKAKGEVAGVLAACGRWKEALPLLEEVAARCPDDAEVQRQLAVAALNAGTYEQALARLERLLEADFERSALWPSFVDAAAGVKKGAMTPEQVRLALRLAAKPAPATTADKVLYLSRLAWILIREGKAAEADRVLDRAIADHPKDPKGRRELAGALTAAGRYKQALEWLEQLAAASPDDVELQGRVAEVALWSGDRTQALERLTKLLSTNIELTQFWNCFVDAAAAVNKGELTPEQVGLAVRMAERLVPASVPEPALYLSRLGWTLFREGRKELAGPLLDRAAAQPPTNPQARRELGGVLTAAGKFREGLKIFEGLELTADDRLSLVVLHAAAKQFDRAEEQCRLVLKERPGDITARRWQADVTLWGGNYGKALGLYEELLTADLAQPALWPGFAEAAVNVAALSDTQAALVLRVAEEPEVAKTEDAVFLARLGLLLYRDADGRNGFVRTAAAVVGGMMGNARPWVAATVLVAQRGNQTRAPALLDRAFALRPKDPTVLARLAWTLFRAGQEARSDVLVAEAIAKEPREPAVRREIGDLLVATGRLTQALPWFEALAADQPNDAELQARLAEVTVWAGEYGPGLRRLEPLLNDQLEQPRLWRPFADAASGALALTDVQVELARRLAGQTPPEAWGMSGRALFLSRLAWALYREGERTGNGALTGEANRLLNAALALKPDDRKVRQEMAGVLTAARRFAEALALTEGLLRESPDDPALRLQVAKLILWSGRHTEALARLEEMLRADFRQPDLWRVYADAAAGAKQLTRLQRELLAQVAQQPADGQPEAGLFWASIAVTLRREAKATGDAALLRQAEVLLDRVIAQPPTAARARLDFAGMLAGADRAKDALELVRPVAVMDPEGRALLVDIYAAARDFDGAEREARALVKLAPDDWEARFKLANVMGWNSKYTEAAELYRTLAAERPGDGRLPLRLAQVTLGAGDYDEALDRFRRLLEEGNRTGEVVNGYIDAAASAKTVNGDANRKATRLAYEALRARPANDPVMLGRLAWVLTRTEEHARSAAVLRQALELDPTSRQLRLRLAQALTEAGQYAEADKHYRLLLRTAPDRRP